MESIDLIKFDKVSFSYTLNYSDSNEKIEKKVLKNISFSVRKGEFLCVLGRNGTGKSTMAKLMNGLLVPTDGAVTVLGMDTKDDSKIWEIRRNVGMVFQNPDNQIIATTVEQDVAFGLENIGVPYDDMHKRVREALKCCGIEELRKFEPHLLSGGQKQRVAIAGILAMRPSCIVLDEATAMLDPKGRKEVLEIAKKLNKEENITVVLITHHMDEVVDADRVIVVDSGDIVLEGTPRAVFHETDIIKSVGLELPPISMLFHGLSKNGVGLEYDVMSIDEGVDVVTELLSCQ